MKKAMILAIALGIVFLQAGFSVAQVISTKELVAAKKAELNNTEWAITITPISGKGRAETDVISFVNNRVVSANLSNAGFSATGFTVRVKKDGIVTWETMQKDGKGRAAFWRGDIKDGVMRGALRKRDSKGRLSDFSFVSQ